MRGSRRTLFRLALLFAGCAVALGAGELLCRLFWDSLHSPEQVDIGYPLAIPAVFTGAEFGLTPEVEFSGRYDGDPYGTLPPDGRISYNREPHRSLIDFILASPAMTGCYRKGSCRIVPGGITTSGSDHNPVVAVFDLK